DLDAEHPPEPIAKRGRRSRARGQGDVVRNRGPEARGRNPCLVACVVDHADDARRAFVPGRRGAEFLYELLIGRAAGYGRRPRVRHVGEQCPERNDELDTELLDMPDDQVRERPPAYVRFDPEQEQNIAIERPRLGVVESRLRPVDLTGDPVNERNVRAGRLEVEEALGIDVRNLIGAPQPREVPGRQRGRLRTVVPTAEGGNENRPSELRPGGNPKLRSHPGSLRGTLGEPRRRPPERRYERDDPRPGSRRDPDVE